MEDCVQIYVDADACPVKAEVLKVAERHGLTVHMVANSWMRLDPSPLINRVVVADGADAADDWIAERAGPGDIVITADIPLASRSIKAGARALGPTGKPFTSDNIGMALAMRNLMADLRESGGIAGNNPVFTPRDRSTFLQVLETEIQLIKRSRPVM
jgi:uncharacterized protein